VQIDILGQFGPAEQSLKGMRVWPYVVRPRSLRYYECTLKSGGTRASYTHPAVLGQIPGPLTSRCPLSPLSSLTISQPEVATVFHLPLSAFVASTRLRLDLFRATNPYWAIDVSDLVQDFEWASDPSGQPKVGDGREERLEVWGLTGWYMSLFMKILRVY